MPLEASSRTTSHNGNCATASRVVRTSRRLLCEFDRLKEHAEIADMIGENEHQPGVELGRGGNLKVSPRLDQREIGSVRIGK